MIRNFHRSRTIFALLPFLDEKNNPYDILPGEETTYKYSDETGLDRVKRLFKPQYDDPLKPLTLSVVQTFLVSFLGGGLIGGIKYSKKAFVDFIDNNDATLFSNQLDAKRKLSDKVILSFTKGIFKFGPKVAFLATTIEGSYAIITAYRGQDSGLHYIAAGGIAGFLYKIPLGPPGMLVGAICGVFLGSILGALTDLILKLSNFTMEELRSQQFQISEKRDQKIIDARIKMNFNTEREEVADLAKNLGKGS